MDLSQREGYTGFLMPMDLIVLAVEFPRRNSRSHPKLEFRQLAIRLFQPFRVSKPPLVSYHMYFSKSMYTTHSFPPTLRPQETKT